jgi:8-oxo-dGTP diphosphatase
MANEYFDIVDENNNKTGQKKLRSVVHNNGSWHRTVHIYYFMKKDSEYYFLVHLRSKENDLCPNMWDTRFGGHLKSGQNIEQTILSELEEEIGLKADIKYFIPGPIIKRGEFLNNEFTYVYYYQGAEDISSLKFIDNEVQEIKWLSAQDIIKEMKNNSNVWAPSLEGFESIYKYLIDFEVAGNN